MGLGDEFKKENGRPSGTAAIDKTFGSMYPDQRSLFIHSPIPHIFAGGGPLDCVGVHDAGDFWHFVTYGFSNTYDVVGEGSEKTEWSGLGFELTLKLKKQPFIASPEAADSEIRTIVGIFDVLANYVRSSKYVFRPYEIFYNEQREGFDARQVSKLTGFATLPDIAGTIETPNGKVEFICLVGMTDKELRSIYEHKHTVKEMLSLLGSDLTDYSRNDAI
ncbi:MAG: suppressor of fused domain protein [Methanomassiliicoccaceae archaeon]|nr:suppressor of fused domain protein [Methanomassiliicoccaceae archaeon]